MKLKLFLVAPVAAVLLLGCSEQAQQEPTGVQGPASTNTQEPAPEAAPSRSQESAPPTDTAQPRSEGSAQSKEGYLTATEEKLREFDQRLNELATEAAQLKDQAKQEADGAIAALRAKRDELDPKLEELKDATSNTWSKFKASVSEALDDLERAYRRAKEKVS